jgi:hypothetical protein
MGGVMSIGNEIVFVLLSLILLTDGAGTKIPCPSNTVPGGPNPNACMSAENSDGKPLPNCVNVGTSDQTPEWVCAQCSHNCDCGPGEYCPKGPGQFTGTCRKISADDKIGRSCVRFGYPYARGWEIPVQGRDELLVCGSPVFLANGTFARYDWIGACVDGTCRECEGGPMSWSISSGLVPLQTYPPMTSAPDYDAHRSRDEGTLSCPGSYCQYGSISRSGAWMLDVLPDGAAMGTLAFVILIFFLLWAMCLLKCCRRRRDLRAMFGRRIGLPGGGAGFAIESDFESVGGSGGGGGVGSGDSDIVNVPLGQRGGMGKAE